MFEFNYSNSEIDQFSSMWLRRGAFLVVLLSVGTSRSPTVMLVLSDIPFPENSIAPVVHSIWRQRSYGWFMYSRDVNSSISVVRIWKLSLETV